MFYHTKRLQYYTRPQRPESNICQESSGTYRWCFWRNDCDDAVPISGLEYRGPAKYRDMLLDTGTEEIGHIEILSTLIGHLLDKAPLKLQEQAAQDPVVGAVMGGTNPRDVITDVIAAAMNPQHTIVTGLGAQPADSVGFPWNGRFIASSGNLLADFRSNLHAESQGRLQAVRLYEMSDDPGVKDTLSFLIARDTMHQNQWLAAIEDIESSGIETTPVPSSFPLELEKREVSYQFWNHSEGTDSAEGRWAKGPSMDGKGEFEYVANPQPLGAEPQLSPANPRLHGTPTPERPKEMVQAHLLWLNAPL